MEFGVIHNLVKFSNNMIDIRHLNLSLVLEFRHEFSNWNSEDADHGLIKACEDVVINDSSQIWAIVGINWEWNLEVQWDSQSWV